LDFFLVFLYQNFEKKKKKKKPWFGFFACHCFPQFCDAGEVAVILKLIYTDLAIKI
jgi:hypothetical protein